MKSGYVTVKSFENCFKDFPESSTVFCANSRFSNVCLGDSGGPAVIDKQLAGTPAFVEDGCNNKTDGAAYTHIYKYRQWIRDNSGLYV